MLFKRILFLCCFLINAFKAISQLINKNKVLLGFCLLIEFETIIDYRIVQASRKDCVLENYFLYLSFKTYVVGTRKNRLNKTGLLNTQNKCLN